MSTDASRELSESELLYEYLGQKMKNGGRDTPIGELLHGYIEYRKQLEDLRGKLRQAEASRVVGFCHRALQNQPLMGASNPASENGFIPLSAG